MSNKPKKAKFFWLNKWTQISECKQFLLKRNKACDWDLMSTSKCKFQFLLRDLTYSEARKITKWIREDRLNLVRREKRLIEL